MITLAFGDENVKNLRGAHSAFQNSMKKTFIIQASGNIGKEKQSLCTAESSKSL